MDILKKFQLFDKEIEINIKGTMDNLLFQANQIVKIIDIQFLNKILLFSQKCLKFQKNVLILKYFIINNFIYYKI